MSIVTHPTFVERRIKSETNMINELYIHLNSYIQFVRELLTEIPDVAAHATFEKLVEVIELSKDSTLSINQRVKCFNTIDTGIALLNQLIEAYKMREDTCQITTRSTWSLLRS